MQGQSFLPPAVITLPDGRRRIDASHLTANFLSINEVVRFRKTLYIYNESTGLWESRDNEEIKRLTSDLLSEEDFSLWTVRVRQNVIEQLDIRIPDLDYNEKAYKNLLALGNCIVNLHTGNVMKYSSKRFFTTKTQYDYNENADCPIFNQYLNTVCEGDTDLILMLEELLGYLLTNQTKIQSVFYLYGTGKNGKSVFLNVVKELVGEGNFITLTLSELEKPFSRSALENKKILLIGDMNKKDSSNFITAEIKKLSGGDMISAEKKYGNVYQFKPAVKVVASSNFLPVSYNDSTYGAQRRIFLIPFRHQITGREEDLSLMDKLRSELSGILNVAMKGLKRLMKNNYQFSFDGTRAWEEIITAEHPLRTFVSEQIVPQIDSKAKYNEIKRAYMEWCAKRRIDCKVPDSKEIYGEVSSIYPNVRQFKSNGDRGIKNVRLKSFSQRQRE